MRAADLNTVREFIQRRMPFPPESGIAVLAALDRIEADYDDACAELLDTHNRAEAAEAALRDAQAEIKRLNHDAAAWEKAHREAEAAGDRLREALEKIASDVEVPRPDGPRPGWCSPQAYHWNWLTDSEIARLALKENT